MGDFNKWRRRKESNVPTACRGRKRRSYHETHSSADYLNWLYFSDTNYNEQVFEQVLREAVQLDPLPLEVPGQAPLQGGQRLGQRVGSVVLARPTHDRP